MTRPREPTASWKNAFKHPQQQRQHYDHRIHGIGCCQARERKKTGNNITTETMGERHEDLVQEYEGFLQHERFRLRERIESAVDDYQQFLAEHAGSQQQKNASGSTALPSCIRVPIKLSELRSTSGGNNAGGGSGGLFGRLRLDPLRHLRALQGACQRVALDDPKFETRGAFFIYLC